MLVSLGSQVLQALSHMRSRCVAACWRGSGSGCAGQALRRLLLLLHQRYAWWLLLLQLGCSAGALQYGLLLLLLQEYGLAWARAGLNGRSWHADAWNTCGAQHALLLQRHLHAPRLLQGDTPWDLLRGCHACCSRHLLQDYWLALLLLLLHHGLLQLRARPNGLRLLQDDGARLHLLLLLGHQHHRLHGWRRLLLAGDEHLLWLLLLLHHDKVWLLLHHACCVLQLHHLLQAHACGPERLLQLGSSGADCRQRHCALRWLCWQHADLLLAAHHCRPHRCCLGQALHDLHACRLLPGCDRHGLVLDALCCGRHQLIQGPEAAGGDELQGGLLGGCLGHPADQQVLRQPAGGVPLQHAGG